MNAARKTKSEPTYAQVKAVEYITMKAADLENAFLAAGIPSKELAALRSAIAELKGLVLK